MVRLSVPVIWSAVKAAESTGTGIASVIRHDDIPRPVARAG